MPNERPHSVKKPLLNAKRRNALKLFALGGGVFMLGKIFGPSLNIFSGSFDGNVYDFKNFRVVENKKGLGFFDKLGNEILVLENDPDAGK